jgi:hypothetical protein
VPIATLVAAVVHMLAGAPAAAAPAPPVVPPPPPAGPTAAVLVETEGLPDRARVVEAFGRIAPRDERLQAEPPGAAQDRESFLLGPVRVVVTSVPGPVAGGRAEAAARSSLSAMGAGWTLPPYHARLLVAWEGPAGRNRVEELRRFTWAVAAVADAAPALAVYWAGAGATHDARFFVETARERGALPLLMLCSGVAIEDEAGGRIAYQTLGLRQLGIPELRVTAPKERGDEALEAALDLASAAVERGAAVPDGGTVARPEGAPLRVRAEPSRADPAQRIWRVDLP